MQRSLVQSSPSSQSSLAAQHPNSWSLTHVPATQLSVVQMFESSQSAAFWQHCPLSILMQSPVSALQESSVHGSPSSQRFSWLEHPFCGLHPSKVHGLLSSQFFGAKLQAPHTSQVPSKHASPSEQSPLLVQPSVTTGIFWQPLAVQRSKVHGSPSSQSAPLVQQSGMASIWQVPLLQVSLVHGFPSSHSKATPLVHAPSWHVSLMVQASPSLQTPTAFS